MLTMKCRFTFLLTLLSIFVAYGQPNLKPSIGIGPEPANNDEVCEIPLYLESIGAAGYFVGDTVPDFNLYDLDGNELSLAQSMADGKPVLLISASYTCFVFRGKVDVINQLFDQYGDEINIYIIYTVEAHPNIDISPYYGFVNVGSSNITEGVLYEQPETYGQRKAVVSDMLTNMDIHAPVYIDGPCNEWWAHFGPAPNNAYLIDPNGVVVAKHPWFDKYPNDMYCDLYTNFGIGDECDVQPTVGEFDFFLTGDSTVTGDAGQTLYVHGKLENNSDGNVLIEIRRMIEDVPAGWATSMCTDICLAPGTDSTSALLEPGEFLLYTMYFYTNEVANEGQVLMGFRNVDSPQNRFSQWMQATTTAVPTAVGEAPEVDPMSLFPNPATTGFQVQLPGRYFEGQKELWMEVFSPAGVLLEKRTVDQPTVTFSAAGLSPGLYVLRLSDKRGLLASGKLLIQAF